MNARRIVRSLHLVTALTAGWVLALTGLTGSVLVFGHAIDRLLNPGLLTVEPRSSRLPLQAAVDAARAAHPGRPVRAVYPPPADTDPCQVHLAGTDDFRVYVDPYTGRVLGGRTPRASLVGFLFALHADLLGGPAGRTAVGVLGLALLLLSVTGLYLWWPPRGQWRQALSIKWRAGRKRAVFDLHRASGAWTFPLLVLAAVTGVALCFPTFFGGIARRLDGTPEPRQATAIPRPTAAIPTLSLDDIVGRADAVLPGGAITRITLPPPGRSDASVRKRLPEDPHPNGMSFVTVDGASGKVVAIQDARRAGAAQAVLDLRYPVHTGEIGGLAFRVLTAAAGIAPATLMATGCLMWWSRRRTRAATRRGTASPASAPPRARVRSGSTPQANTCPAEQYMQ